MFLTYTEEYAFAEGSFGKLYLGTLGRMRKNVALKVFRNSGNTPLTEKQRRDAENEVLTVRYLENRDFIVACHGYYVDRLEFVMSSIWQFVGFIVRLHLIS